LLDSVSPNPGEARQRVSERSLRNTPSIDGPVVEDETSHAATEALDGAAERTTEEGGTADSPDRNATDRI
jgi:hypothetical protein